MGAAPVVVASVVRGAPDLGILILSTSIYRYATKNTQIRIGHFSPDAPAVDVQVVDGPTLFRNVEFGAASDYIGVDASTYDIDVMPAGSDDAVLSLSDIDLPSGQTVTVFATGLVDDDTLDATFVTDFTARNRKRAASR